MSWTAAREYVVTATMAFLVDPFASIFRHPFLDDPREPRTPSSLSVQLASFIHLAILMSGSFNLSLTC